MKKVIVCIFNIIVLLTLTGCMNAFFPQPKSNYADKALETIGQQAEFDLACKEVQKVLLGDVTKLGPYIAKMNIGVTGCGKQATYYAECTNSQFSNKVTCTFRLGAVQETNEE